MTSPSTIAGTFAFGVALVGCGGGNATGGGNAFGDWSDDQGASTAQLWSRLKDAAVARGADAVLLDVLVGAEGHMLDQHRTAARLRLTQRQRERAAEGIAARWMIDDGIHGKLFPERDCARAVTLIFDAYRLAGEA